ncbi:ABC transporter substrate-binding protein [Marinomonas agarivorans]|nr:ABC transporter substrate-binding protein [Marinomonas agarivorans]
MIKYFVAGCLATSFLAFAETPPPWGETLKDAEKQTVYWNAWGGADNINAYIDWVAKRVKEDYKITLKHVKLADTADAVSRVLAEKAAGNDTNGSIDLIWINGENFRTLKNNNLLFGPFSNNLPNYRYVDESSRTSLTQDFGTKVDGMESPWGAAQVIFMHDTEILVEPPKSIPSLLDYAKKNPGRITYPEPPQFLGTTFLKQALIELTNHPEKLSAPVSDANFTLVTEPLWAYLDELHPVAWRQGSSFPSGAEQMMRLLDDQEIDIALSFDVSAASVQIEQGNLPDTVRSYVFENGTIGNTHFVAIPYNSASTAGAQVVADFLLSPEAQLKKQHPTTWGDLSVLTFNRLPKKYQTAFNDLPRGVATLSIESLGKSLPEPHGSWVEALEKEWRKRYSR